MPKYAKQSIHQGSFKSKADHRAMEKHHNKLEKLAQKQDAVSLLLSQPQASSVNLPVWLIVILLFSTVTATKEFPLEGSYSEQKDFINSLTHECQDSSVIGVLNQARNAPLKMQVDNIPAGVKYEVFKHSFFPADNTAMRRHITMTSDKLAEIEKNRQDTTEIIIGSEGNNGAILHKFKLNANGDWTPSGKEKKSMEEHTKAMKQPEEYIVKASNPESKTEVSECYIKPGY